MLQKISSMYVFFFYNPTVLLKLVLIGKVLEHQVHCSFLYGAKDQSGCPFRPTFTAKSICVSIRTRPWSNGKRCLQGVDFASKFLKSQSSQTSVGCGKNKPSPPHNLQDFKESAYSLVLSTATYVQRSIGSMVQAYFGGKRGTYAIFGG